VAFTADLMQRQSARAVGDALRGAAGGIQGMSRRPPADRYVTLLSRPDLIQRPMCPRGSDYL